ncbi:MAG: hypothetical protein IH956_03120 [Chloroflexi bacterium]|nr:hypothetical protein [Chloroflexota bacterium]
MPEAIEVENIGDVVHRYEHWRTGVVYVWPAGESREVPDEVAQTVTRAHPNKMRYAHRMMDTRAPAPVDIRHRHYWRLDDTCRCGAQREAD